MGEASAEAPQALAKQFSAENLFKAIIIFVKILPVREFIFFHWHHKRSKKRKNYFVILKQTSLLAHQRNSYNLEYSLIIFTKY
jgi:hypothetical protein